MGSGKWAYHQTLPWHIDGIVREGLIPQTQSSHVGIEGAVLFFTNTDQNFRNPSRAYLRFPWPENAHQLDSEAWVIDYPVPPEELEIFIPDGSGKSPVEKDWTPLIETRKEGLAGLKKGWDLFHWSRCGDSLVYKIETIHPQPWVRYGLPVAPPEGDPYTRDSGLVLKSNIYLKLDDQTIWEVTLGLAKPGYRNIKAWSLWIHPETVEEVIITRSKTEVTEKQMRNNVFMEAMEGFKTIDPDAWVEKLEAQPPDVRQLILDTLADVGMARYYASSSQRRAVFDSMFAPSEPLWRKDEPFLPLKMIYDAQVPSELISDVLEAEGVFCGYQTE